MQREVYTICKNGIVGAWLLTRTRYGNQYFVVASDAAPGISPDTFVAFSAAPTTFSCNSAVVDNPRKALTRVQLRPTIPSRFDEGIGDHE